MRKDAWVSKRVLFTPFKDAVPFSKADWAETPNNVWFFPTLASPPFFTTFWSFTVSLFFKPPLSNVFCASSAAFCSFLTSSSVFPKKPSTLASGPIFAMFAIV